jgi:hypothetical protein
VVILAALGGLAFVVASLVIGLRLMLLAGRTRGLPEAVLGFGLFAMGGLGYPLMTLSLTAKSLPHGLRVAMAAVQMALWILGMTGFVLFTQRVFRPDRAWAKVVVAVATAGYLAGALAQTLGPGLAAHVDDPHGPWSRTLVLGAATLLWAGVESLRYYLMLRKRLALGLADPAVTDRFRLWAIGMIAAASLSATSVVFDELLGVPMIASTAGSALVGAGGCVCAGSMWLAFLPPRAYLRRVAARWA